MAMDGLSLHAMLWEARGLLGARVDKVQQPDKDTLLLSCHGTGCGRVKLLVNIHNENGRIALTRDTAENPAAAPAFCMLLRKRLIGSRITGMDQAGLDRTVRFSFSGRLPAGRERGHFGLSPTHRRGGRGPAGVSAQREI